VGWVGACRKGQAARRRRHISRSAAARARSENPRQRMRRRPHCVHRLADHMAPTDECASARESRPQSSRKGARCSCGTDPTALSLRRPTDCIPRTVASVATRHRTPRTLDSPAAGVGRPCDPRPRMAPQITPHHDEHLRPHRPAPSLDSGDALYRPSTYRRPLAA